MPGSIAGGQQILLRRREAPAHDPLRSSLPAADCVSEQGLRGIAALVRESLQRGNVTSFGGDGGTCSCGRLDADGNGGHAHADQLAVELAIGGVPVWSDPGSFCYTPFPELRQAYRSASAHHVPRPAGAGEPVRLDLGLFRLVDRSDAECLSFDAGGFVGRHRGYGFTVCRAVVVGEDALSVIDWIPDDAGAAPDDVAWLDPEPVPFSRGYGLR